MAMADMTFAAAPSLRGLTTPARLSDAAVAAPPAAAASGAGARSFAREAAAVAAGVALAAGSRKAGAPRRARAVRVAATAETEAKVEVDEARPVFPFSAIVGQQEMKLALILNVIDPKIGGVMILGDRGTGKTTTIRALVDLLPEISCVAGLAFGFLTRGVSSQAALRRRSGSRPTPSVS